MENVQNVAAEAAQNAAMQQVINPANGAEAQADVPAAKAPAEAVAEKPKSKLEIATANSYSDQHEAFGTHFGKTMKEVDVLLKRVQEQLANLPKWKANLLALETELKQKKAAENFAELKAMYAYLSEEQKAALAAS